MVLKLLIFHDRLFTSCTLYLVVHINGLKVVNISMIDYLQVALCIWSLPTRSGHVGGWKWQYEQCRIPVTFQHMGFNEGKNGPSLNLTNKIVKRRKQNRVSL